MAVPKDLEVLDVLRGKQKIITELTKSSMFDIKDNVLIEFPRIDIASMDKGGTSTAVEYKTYDLTMENVQQALGQLEQYRKAQPRAETVLLDKETRIQIAEAHLRGETAVVTYMCNKGFLKELEFPVNAKCGEPVAPWEETDYMCQAIVVTTGVKNDERLQENHDVDKEPDQQVRCVGDKDQTNASEDVSTERGVRRSKEETIS